MSGAYEHIADFKIPKGFKHRWLFVAGPYRTVIVTVPDSNIFQSLSFVDESKLEEFFPPWEELTPVHKNWTENSLAEMRRMCTPEAGK